MINKYYSPIKDISTKATFSNYIDSLDIPQIDYFAIGIQDVIANSSISLMSSTEWQKYYTYNQLANYDPIRRVALNTKRNIIPFDQIDFFDNYGREIMRQRSLMGIKNGIILMERFPKYNYMVTLGTGFSSFDAFDFVKRYHDKIQLIKNDFMQLIQKEAINFILK